MEVEKKSILNEALAEYKEIEKVVKNKLAEQYSEKFENLLKEELGRKKDIDDKNNKNDNDTVMKKQNDEIIKEGVNVPFTPNAKVVAEEESNVTGLESGSEVNEEYLSLEEIEKELDAYETPASGLQTEPEEGGEEGIEPEFGSEEPEAGEEPEGDVKSQLLDLKLKLDTLINSLSGEEGGEEEPEIGFEPEAEPEEEPEAEPEEEITENDFPSDEEIYAVLNGGDENEIEESHGVSYPTRRNVTGRHLPNAEYLSTGEADQEPYLAESLNKRIEGLMNENKSLTKKVNDLTKNKKETETIVEKYKVVLNKYRTQLNEMAVFNTNLAHVNNLLVNEEFALTQADKLNIINGFKSVKTINESETKYNTLVENFKTTKATIVESVEQKVVDSIQPSAKSIVETTVYTKDSGIGRIHNIIEKIERKRNK